MGIMKKVITIFALGAVLYAVLPLFGKNYIPTHDGEYHIIRIVEFTKMLGEGNIVPRWAPDLNSSYGIPIFEFHYPLPNYIGSFVRVFTRDAVYAFQASMGIGYIAVAAGAYLWLSALFGTVPALIGVIFAAFVPYLFVDMYVRGSIGEIWAMAFLFFAFYTAERKRFFWVAVSYGLLILSHNILATLFTPLMFTYLLVRDRRAILWMAGGLGLSAFFWLPALLESRYVVGLNTVNFREHFIEIHELLVPSWGTQFSGSGSLGNKISFQLGIAPILALLGAAWSQRRQKNKKIRQLFFLFTGILAVSVAFMLPVSRGIWELVRPLQLVQYPWRLLSFVVPVSAFTAAFWVYNMKRKWLGVVFGIVAVLLAAAYSRPALYAPRNEAYYLSRPNFTDGTSSTGNSFSTIWTGWKTTRPEISYPVSGSYLDRNYQVQMHESGDVALPILYFPGWKATLDGSEMAIDYQKDGTIHVAVPEGTHTVRAYFTETPIRKIADIISIVSLVVLAFYEYRNRHNPT